LLKIKKEDGGISEKKGDGKASTAQKGHKKRHSDFHGGATISHKRRGS
jgi:hypothetical protein